VKHGLQTGDAAPDITVIDLEGQAVPLSSLWGDGRFAVLVFLRHLG